MQVDRRAFLRGLLASGAALVAAPVVAGAPRASEVMQILNERYAKALEVTKAAIGRQLSIIHGFDAYGSPISETAEIVGDTTAFQKAFRRVTRISVAPKGASASYRRKISDQPEDRHDWINGSFRPITKAEYGAQFDPRYSRDLRIRSQV